MIKFMDQSTYDSLDRISKEYILIEILVDDATFPEDDDHILDASYLKFYDLSDSVQNAILSGAYDRFVTATEFEHDPEDEPEWGEDWKEDDGEAYQFNDYDYIDDDDDESFDPDEYDYDEESYASESDGMQVDWWDSLSQDERINWMNSFSMTPTDGSIYMDNYDEMDSSNQYYVKSLFRFVKDNTDNDLLGRNHNILGESYASEDEYPHPDYKRDPDNFYKDGTPKTHMSIPEIHNFIISNFSLDHDDKWVEPEYGKSVYEESYASEDSYPSRMIRKGQQYTKKDHYDYKDVGGDTFIVCDICGWESGKLRPSTSGDFDDTIHRRLEDHVASVHGLVRNNWAESYVKKAKYTSNEGMSLADWAKFQDEHGWYRVGVSHPTPEIEDIARSMGGNYYGISPEGYGIQEWSFHNYSDAENFAQYVEGKSKTFDYGSDYEKYGLKSRYQPEEQHYVERPHDVSPYVFNGGKFTNIGSGAIGGHPLRNNPFGESYSSEGMVYKNDVLDEIKFKPNSDLSYLEQMLSNFDDGDMTVSQAIQELQEDGKIEWTGRGYSVASTESYASEGGFNSWYYSTNWDKNSPELNIDLKEKTLSYFGLPEAWAYLKWEDIPQHGKDKISSESKASEGGMWQELTSFQEDLIDQWIDSTGSDDANYIPNDLWEELVSDLDGSYNLQIDDVQRYIDYKTGNTDSYELE